MKKKVCVILILFFCSCASGKWINIDGKDTKVKPYGFANKQKRYNDKVMYQVNPGNVWWSIVFMNTLIVPTLLCGWQFFEPLEVKK